jgi:penicillin-binding protein 1A
MAEAGVITPEQARTGGFAEVHLTRSESLRGGYFADWVSRQAKRAFDAHYGEVRVASTLEGDLQRRAERVVAAALEGQGAESGAGQAALVALRPDGRVAAMVGGRDYSASPFNRATQAKRQPGSAFKLFVYLAALRAGLTPDSLVLDAPVAVGDWRPENADGRYAGVITLREAFARSSNAATVRVAQAVGAPAVVRAARDLGVVSPLPEDDPTLALGTTELPLIELTAAYAAVAAGRAPVRPHGLAPSGASTGAPLDPSHRAALLDLLSAVTERGTGRAARLSAPAFGKTGTTSSNRDALFIGFAGDLVVGVWVGNDDQTPMDDVSGGGLPAEIWRDFVAGAQGLRAAPAAPSSALATLAPTAALVRADTPTRTRAPPRTQSRDAWRETRTEDRGERRKARGKRGGRGKGRD